jgi:hypothetical protein
MRVIMLQHAFILNLLCYQLEKTLLIHGNAILLTDAKLLMHLMLLIYQFNTLKIPQIFLYKMISLMVDKSIDQTKNIQSITVSQICKLTVTLLATIVLLVPN